MILELMHSKESVGGLRMWASSYSSFLKAVMVIVLTGSLELKSQIFFSALFTHASTEVKEFACAFKLGSALLNPKPFIIT